MREAFDTYRQGWALGKRFRNATLQLGAVLALLPALLLAAIEVSGQTAILSVWEGWLQAVFSASMPAETLSTLLMGTLQAADSHGLAYMLISLAVSLLAVPLLGASQAMLYNGHTEEDAGGLEVARNVSRAIRPLAITALLCLLVQGLLEMIPSLLSGLLSAVSGLLAWIPFVGPLVRFLVVIIAFLLDGLSQGAAAVLLCYVWISAGCEGVGGKGALVRSFMLMRSQMEKTACAVLGLLLLRWMAMAAMGILWLVCFAVLNVPAGILVYVGAIFKALEYVAVGLAASVLYQQRSLQGYGFSSSRPDIHHMKSANL